MERSIPDMEGPVMIPMGRHVAGTSQSSGYSAGEPPFSQYGFFRNFERVINFSDGVFSIAITLMVLSLTIPVLTSGGVTELPVSLIHQLPIFFIYAISFLVIGDWWIVHHSIFQHINQADRKLLWLNLLFLLFITLIPFQTTLMIKYPGTFTAAAYFAGTQAIAAIFICILWFYASKDHRLTDPDLPQVTTRYYFTRAVIRVAVFVASIIIAVFSVFLAELSWIMLGFILWGIGQHFNKNYFPENDSAE